MVLIETVSRYWRGIQKSLFPWLEEEVGELDEKEKKLVATLELIRIEEILEREKNKLGRPPASRIAMARAFVAKAVYNIPTTEQLIMWLKKDKKLRMICGWKRGEEIPSESTFSRAFGEFAETQLAERVHERLIKSTMGEIVVGHISRDSTAIESREKPKKKEKKEKKKDRKKRGRAKKGEEKPKEETRLERHIKMSTEEILNDLPKFCDVGSKKNSKGYEETWIGYKLHIDVGDRQIPISCILTSASLHDSQAAIGLANLTKERVVNLYDLMDSAYDSSIIREHSTALGHVPIIDVNPRRNTQLKEDIELEVKRLELLHFEDLEKRRYKERTAIERINSRLKDEFGGRIIFVKGAVKVMAHLMFGILALTADQLLRLVQ